MAKLTENWTIGRYIIVHLSNCDGKLKSWRDSRRKLEWKVWLVSN